MERPVLYTRAFFIIWILFIKIMKTTKALQLAQIIIESHKSHYDGMN